MPYVGRAQAQKALIKALPDILEEVSRGRRRSPPFRHVDDSARTMLLGRAAVTYYCTA